MRNLAAITATNTTIVHERNGLSFQRVGVWLDGERWAPTQANAGVIAGTGFLVDPESIARNPLSADHSLREKRFLAARPVQHAFRLRYEHLGAGIFTRYRLLERFTHFRNVVGLDRFRPFDANTACGALDRMLRTAIPGITLAG